MPLTRSRQLAATGSTWAVAAPHHLASDAAADIFRGGGNAVDAAVAAAAVLTVVYPNQCSVGGDLLALVAAPDGSVSFVNASGRAPHAVDADAIAARGRTMPISGALPVTVPGVVSGWSALNERWGTLPLPAVLDRAVNIAGDGAPVSPGLARDFGRELALLERDPGMREVFFAGGRPLRAGEPLRQPQLATSLAAIAGLGADAVYRGPVGAAIIGALQRLGSAMTLTDFAEHTVEYDEVVSTHYAGLEYVSSASNSQGTFFLEGLHALDELRAEIGPIDALGRDAGRVALVLAHAAADRDRLLADPRFADVPVEWALSTGRAKALVQHALAGQRPMIPAATTSGSGDTVAVVAADGRGNWVSLIQSVFHAFGSGILEPATGIVLHNRGASFSLDQNSPNRLAGGKRPLHTLMPVLVRSAGRVVGAHGAMGGRAQPQVHTHLALQLAAGASLSGAITDPRWVLGPMEAGTTEPATLVKVERAIPEVATAAMQAVGFTTSTLADHDDGVGHAQLVRLDPASAAVLHAATDPRADGSALAG